MLIQEFTGHEYMIRSCSKDQQSFIYFYLNESQFKNIILKDITIARENIRNLGVNLTRTP